MKYWLGMFLFFLFALNCQKDSNRNVDDKIIVKTNENIILDSDSTDLVQQHTLTPDSGLATTKTDSLDTEKLPKLKPADYSNLASSTDLWGMYEQTRNDITLYKDNWNFPELLKSLNKAAEISLKLHRADIAAWQFNNIGYYSILEFQKRTDYSNRMQDIQAMPTGPERDQFIQETREILLSEIELLNSAEQSLYDAIELDNHEPDKNRQNIINSNLEFIRTINSFTKN